MHYNTKLVLATWRQLGLPVAVPEPGPPPPPRAATASTAYGTATIQLSGDSTFAMVNLNFSNLSSPQTVAYLRLGTPNEVGTEVLRLPNGQVTGQRWTFPTEGALTAAQIVQAIPPDRLLACWQRRIRDEIADALFVCVFNHQGHMAGLGQLQRNRDRWIPVGCAGREEAASAPESLLVIFIGVAITLPAIIVYTVFMYRVFWGRASVLSYLPGQKS